MRAGGIWLARSVRGARAGCVVGERERWQRTAEGRQELRLRVLQTHARLEPEGSGLRVTAWDQCQAEERSLRTYSLMQEGYSLGGDVEEQAD